MVGSQIFHKKRGQGWGGGERVEEAFNGKFYVNLK